MYLELKHLLALSGDRSVSARLAGCRAGSEHALRRAARLIDGRADLVITSDPIGDLQIAFRPLFRFEVRLAVPRAYALSGRDLVEPEDLAGECLITYPVMPSRLDVFQQFLAPAGVNPAQVRTAELSMMILELVKSGRGVAALPSWVMAAAVEAKQIAVPALGTNGLWSTLYSALRADVRGLAYLDAFFETAQQTALRTLSAIEAAR